MNYLLFLNRMTQKELALGVGMSPVQFSKKMNGVSRWSVDDLLALADFFQVDLNYMVGRRPIESVAPRNEKTPAALATGVSDLRAPRDSNPRPSDP